jgi:4-hydroxymandelate oxidase
MVNRPSTGMRTLCPLVSIKRLRDTVNMKIMLKGILTSEDAKLAADYGIDGIIVSNHSRRVIDSGRATIEVLPEIIEVVGGRMPVLVDSGFRRGTDIIKALAMGAQAVCIGQPYLWGLGAFGQPGCRACGLLPRGQPLAFLLSCEAWQA